MSDIEAARAAAERAKLAADQAVVSAMHAESCAQDAATNAAAAKISADEAAVAATEVLAALDGEIVPPEPGDGPLPAGRLSWGQPATPFTAPIVHEKGVQRDAALIAMVLVSHRTEGVHQKFCGAPSSAAPNQAALGLGVTDQGRLQAFRCNPFTEVAYNSLTWPHGKAEFVLYRWAVPTWLQIGGTVAQGNVGATSPAALDGEFIVGAGAWKGDFPLDPVHGEVRAYVTYDESADPAEVASVWRAEWQTLLDAPVEPPVTTPPVLDILDAPTITAGETAAFPLRLDQPSSGTITVNVVIDGEGADPVTIPPGVIASTVRKTTVAGSGARTMTATLSDAAGNVAIGRATATCEVRAATIPPNGGNGGGEGGDLERPDPNALRIDIVIDAQQRQTVVGHGFGLGSHSNAVAGRGLIKQHAKTIFTDMNCQIVRVHNPQEGGFVESYKSSVETAVAHGVLHVLCTCYMYRSKSTPAKLAVALNNALRSGIPITYACFQNEPDGNALNSVTGNWVAAYRELRELLDPRIKIIANEWRHPEKGIPEFDGLKKASQLHMLAAGALHIYDKAGNPALYDERWLKAGLPIWSCETGDGASPKTQARYVAGLLTGCAAEIAHIGHATAATKPDDLRQYLFDAGGKPLAWTPSCGLIARSVLPGTVMRGATSSDRPPGLGEAQAERMLWWTAQRQPRQFVAGGRRADGRWVVASVSHAFGNDSPSQWAGGHYKAERQQLTARVAELVGQNATFLGQRCSIGGALSAVIKYPLVDGRLRWTLAPGETLVMVQAA